VIEVTTIVSEIICKARCASLILEQLKRCPSDCLINYVNADCPGGFPEGYTANRYSWSSGRWTNRTALQIAIAGRSLEIVELLLSHGADVNVHPMHIVTSGHPLNEKEDVEMIELLLRYGTELDVSNGEGQTALLKGASNGGLKIVRLLLQNGADPNAKDCYRCTPLHMALSDSKQSVETVRTLLRHGADLNARDIGGETALHKGVKSNNVEICKLLLEYGAAVDARNRVGETPLYQAARRGMLDITSLLLQHGADVNGYHNADDTALRIAIQHGRIQVVRALLIYGAGVSGLYTHVDGRASFMEDLRHTESDLVRVIIRLVDHVKDIPLALRFRANSALDKIVMEEGVQEYLLKDSDSEDSHDGW
jgi:ankyrin repeat protein